MPTGKGQQRKALLVQLPDHPPRQNHGVQVREHQIRLQVAGTLANRKQAGLQPAAPGKTIEAQGDPLLNSKPQLPSSQQRKKEPGMAAIAPLGPSSQARQMQANLPSTAPRSTVWKALEKSTFKKTWSGAPA